MLYFSSILLLCSFLYAASVILVDIKTKEDSRLQPLEFNENGRNR